MNNTIWMIVQNYVYNAIHLFVLPVHYLIIDAYQIVMMTAKIVTIQVNVLTVYHNNFYYQVLVMIVMIKFVELVKITIQNV